MKHIQPIIITAAITLLSFSAVLNTSCNKSENSDPNVNNSVTGNDPCKDVKCQNGGTCKNGKCICPSGYEGDNCERLIAQKFTGNWTAFVDCSGEPASSHPVNIELVSTGTNELYLYDKKVKGKLISPDSLEIPTQYYSYAGKDTIKGIMVHKDTLIEYYYYHYKGPHIKGDCAGVLKRK